MRKLMRFYSLLILCLMIISTVLLPAYSVKAEGIPNYELLNLIEKVKEEYTSLYGVSEESLEPMIEKLLNGITLDCEDPEKLSVIDLEQYNFISIEEMEQGIMRKFHQFEDGSIIGIALEEVERPVGITPFLIINGSAGTQYIDHQITKSYSVYSVWAYINGFLTKSGYGTSEIANIHSPGYMGIAISGAAWETLVRRLESGLHSALATVTWVTAMNISADTALSWLGSSVSYSVGSQVTLFIEMYNHRLTVGNRPVNS